MIQTVYYCVNEVVPGAVLIHLALSWPCEANADPSETYTHKFTVISSQIFLVKRQFLTLEFWHQIQTCSC